MILSTSWSRSPFRADPCSNKRCLPPSKTLIRPMCLTVDPHDKQRQKIRLDGCLSRSKSLDWLACPPPLLSAVSCQRRSPGSGTFWVLLCVNIPYITSLLHHGYYIIVRSSIVHEVLYYTGSASSTSSKVVSSTGSE